MNDRILTVNFFDLKPGTDYGKQRQQGDAAARSR
jgi:hypothetical protein